MKKKETLIIAVIAIVSVLAIVLMKTTHKASSTVSSDPVSSEVSSAEDNEETEDTTETVEEGSESETEETADPSETKEPTDPASVTVDIYHGNELVKSFNPSIDNVYHITGDYGGLDVEVVDGKWHVTNEECPNHICNGMGWMGPDDIIPISCLPNDVYVIVR